MLSFPRVVGWAVLPALVLVGCAGSNPPKLDVRPAAAEAVAADTQPDPAAGAVYRIDSAHQSPFLATTGAVTKNNAYAYAAPPMSATMLIFTAP